MALRSPTYLAGAFLALAVAYSAYFNVAVRIDADAAQARCAPGKAMTLKPLPL
jgi:hypothetical protein